MEVFLNLMVCTTQEAALFVVKQIYIYILYLNFFDILLYIYFYYLFRFFIAVNILSIARREPVTQAFHCKQLLNVTVLDMTINSWISWILDWISYPGGTEYNWEETMRRTQDILEGQGLPTGLLQKETNVWASLLAPLPHVTLDREINYWINDENTNSLLIYPGGAHTKISHYSNKC